MNFRSMSVKDCFDNPKTAAVIKQMAPELMKYPIKLFYKKSCGEVFDMVVSSKLVSAERAKKIELAVNEVLKD